VARALEELFEIRERPRYLRGDNGPEFASKAVKKWLARQNLGTLFTEPGIPRENGYRESFNGNFAMSASTANCF